MRRLNDTLTRMSAMRAGLAGMSAPLDDGALQDIGAFGSNPGALRGLSYIPAKIGPRAPLVVVLHGCTQTAAAYDHSAGWRQLADLEGFALLYPEQQRANNANLCFNWFDPQDTRRGGGEALSIRQMVAAMVAAHGLDPARVYVTGLSAGGAMTSVMLATYPEVFAGGAIIAGLPYGVAGSMPEAFDRMRGHGGPQGAALGRLVAGASDHRGPWPTVSVWHGDRDPTVSVANADLIVEQWRTLHGVAEAPTAVQVVGRHARRVWRDATGRDVIEAYRIVGLGHGTPLSTAGADVCGAVGPHMLEAGISSTRHIARSWGLHDMTPLARPEPADARIPPPETTSGAGRPGDVHRVINDALRAAGLMR